VQDYHAAIIDDLWGEPTNINEVTLLFGQLRNIVNDIVYRQSDAELWYDTIVAYGELISTTIISKYLNHIGMRNRWIDMRTTLLTNQRHKDANVDIKASKHRLRASIENTGVGVFVGQGFIGGAPDGTTTTLGREGSDYSAAVVAHILNAESMSVWKDVDGVLNADPKLFKEAVKIDALNYLDTIELAYSGAQIIHPKTIKPLQNKNIPLYVRPFGDKTKPGTVINGEAPHVTIPIMIYKPNQVLLIIRSKDFSFVMEEQFGEIFSMLDSYRIKTHLINNSAVDLGLCVDASWHIDELTKALEEEGYQVEKTEDVGLLTIRNYNSELYDRYVHGQQHIIRQVNPESVRVVLRSAKFD
jgi:aspartate kinase